MQYPVMPWVIADYSSTELGLLVIPSLTCVDDDL